ncbi:unnamed protein product [Phytophthora fragariaefolia]|uniref:Unnamed protein product n=1 Tax=Phytophthora fragariaefolia TaxID=1490495 RepID=A0A9W7CTR1_9STRA|nr:unnamed protein product [Phytophthora fragariaefolia]
MSEKKPRAVRSPVQKRQRPHSKLDSDPEEASVSSDASGDLHERVSPHSESIPKRRKGSEASSAASGSVSGSSTSSSPSDESSDEGVPAPEGFSATKGGQQLAARESNGTRASTQNGGFVGNAHVIKSHRTQQKANYRLKLLAELRGIVETVSLLASQLANGAASPMGMVPGSRVDPTLAEEVQQDLRFFREQKRRLQQELDALEHNPKFLETLLEQAKAGGDGGSRKRRRLEAGGSDEEEYSSSTTSSDDSDTAEDDDEEEEDEDEEHERIRLAKVGAISSRQVSAQSSGWHNLRPGREADSVVITFDDVSDDGELPRLECDREVANAYVRLRVQTLQQDRRLKLLAELRGVVSTISQLAQQLAWNGVAAAALAARTGGVCPALDQDVLRDIAFFRHEKQRLKQEIAALDGGAFANASCTHQVRAPPGGEALQFIPGSMDDTIMETLETGDVIFFQRKLTAMQPLAALHTWVTRLRLRPRFDHCGWIYVDRLGRKFIVEETLDKVQCRPYSARVLTSEATEISVLTLKLEEAANSFIAKNLGRASRISLRHTVSALITPEEMRRASPDGVPAFPCAGAGAGRFGGFRLTLMNGACMAAAFVVEAYDAMGLATKNQLTNTQPPISSATVSPRDFASSKIRLQSQAEGAKPPAFGRLLPIRLE